ncbi:MAG TPA: gluconate 2-dehydrogenase subunit 3 family protein [Paenibacillus sp.]|nr:gluconate 2-dehydrogenase subunit 3 family protein [Paenibacillus sp.]
MHNTLPTKSHYPDYDVMKEQEHWDPHTQSIVAARLHSEYGFRFLTLVEAEQLGILAGLLTGDDRAEIVSYIVSSIDESLGGAIGESERKAGVPKAQELMRQGLRLLDAASVLLFQAPYISIAKDKQRLLLEGLGEDRPQPEPTWRGFPAKPFFMKLMSLSHQAYYSHPTVWSEIGYGGPAYPRGYIRAHPNQLDPWEAKKSGQ